MNIVRLTKTQTVQLIVQIIPHSRGPIQSIPPLKFERTARKQQKKTIIRQGASTQAVQKDTIH